MPSWLQRKGTLTWVHTQHFAKRQLWGDGGGSGGSGGSGSSDGQVWCLLHPPAHSLDRVSRGLGQFLNMRPAGRAGSTQPASRASVADHVLHSRVSGAYVMARAEARVSALQAFQCVSTPQTLATRTSLGAVGARLHGSLVGANGLRQRGRMDSAGGCSASSKKLQTTHFAQPDDANSYPGSQHGNPACEQATWQSRV